MKWISAKDVIAIHDRLLSLMPGVEGMPEAGRADAIIYRVQNKLFYEHVDDVFILAAMYLVAIARGHIFNDGNKRTAFFVAMAFLNRNGVVICDEGMTLEDLTVSAAVGEIDVDSIAAILRALS